MVNYVSGIYFGKFVLCSKCVYSVVFTREMIVYVCIRVYQPVL